jgi:microsomal dipeptidase-like Zn-dependent dipeptidase
VDIPHLIEGDVAIQVLAAVTKSPKGQNYDNNAADAPDNTTPLVVGQIWPPRTWASLLERALYQIEKLHAIAEHSPDQLSVITSLTELETHLADRAAGSKVIGGILGIEGAHPLQDELSNMDTLEAAVHRVIGLQHFFDTI